MLESSPYMLVERKMVKSSVFQSLSGTSKTVLMLFLYRRQYSKLGRKGKGPWVLTNNGEIIFTYQEALTKWGITKSRFARALDELIEKGFININHLGGGMVKDTSTYFISERWKDYGTAQFIKKSRPKDTRGLGITKENWEERTGKKRKPSSNQGNSIDTRTSNKNLTRNTPASSSTSNKNVTEQNGRKALILKAMRQYSQIMKRSNKNVTVL
jgi:hypothetical protein